MKTLKKYCLRISLLLLGLILLGLFIIKADLASEGYGSWVAVRNYLIRDGQIKVVFLDDKKVISAHCSDSKNIQIEDSTATIKVGYTWCQTEVTYLDANQDTKTVTFDTQKLNNWNRVCYLEQENGTFLRFDNGAKRK